MHDFTCRRLTEPEWRTYADLRLEALAADPRAFGSSLEREAGRGEAEWRAHLADGRTGIFALRAGDSPIGLTGVGIHRDDPSGETALLWGSWIHPAYRRLGLSDLLYRARLDWARTRPGVRRVVTSHWADNEPSRRACLRNGFRFLHEELMERASDGAKLPHLHYELLLAPPSAGA